MGTIFTIKGVHCQSCKVLIEEVAMEIPGVESCTVDFKTGRMKVEHGDKVDWVAFMREVEGLGAYKVDLKSDRSDKTDKLYK